MPHDTATRSPQSKGWTPERRAKHAAAMRRWKPWEKSTGPKTMVGKAVSSRNACKHMERTIGLAPLIAAVAKQKQRHSYAARYAKSFTTCFTKNELLDDPIYLWLNALIEAGRNELLDLFRPSIMQKTCLSGPLEANS